jgi:hypothetical protein
MKTITKTAKLALAAILLTFCLACEEKEKAKTEADEVAKTETEALAKAIANVEAEVARVAAQAEAEAAAKVKTEVTEALAKATRAAAKIKCTSSGNSSEQTDDVKLLECITDGKGKAQKKFEYDGQNRLVKTYDYGSDGVFDTQTITYNTDNSVMVEETHSNYGNHIDYGQSVKIYVRKGNKITVDTIAFTINEDGYIVKSKYFTNQYQDGNLIIYDDTENGYRNGSSYEYDDKKSPFSNSNTSKWLLQHLVGHVSASKNNVLENNYITAGEDMMTGSYSYKYEYDSDGFPTKQTCEWYSEGNEETTTTRYTYRSGAKQ